jgi:hypothetical protein
VRTARRPSGERRLVRFRTTESDSASLAAAGLEVDSGPRQGRCRCAELRRWWTMDTNACRQNLLAHGDVSAARPEREQMPAAVLQS